MIIQPEIKEEAVIVCLEQEYGLRIAQLTFLPIGGDLCTAVYRAVDDSQTAYFCKLRCTDFEEISVELPRFLSQQGIPQILSPVPTERGHLWAELESFKLILYPFVEGVSGFEVELSDRHWESLGTALKQIHSTILPEALSRKIPKESYSPEWRDRCKEILKRLDGGRFADPITRDLAAYLLAKRETILDLLERAERLAQRLVSYSPEFVLCHSDIHPGNLFIENSNGLYIVDWDYPVLAPKERDLMFIGGGQGYQGITAQEEVQNFYQHYGPAPIDPVAMAYYRFERNIVDITVESRRVLTERLGEQERAHSLEIITWAFLPDSTVEMAYQSDIC